SRPEGGETRRGHSRSSYTDVCFGTLGSAAGAEISKVAAELNKPANLSYTRHLPLLWSPPKDPNLPNCGSTAVQQLLRPPAASDDPQLRRLVPMAASLEESNAWFQNLFRS
ncbi:unnamed protein product, partial [Pylaiella littoralis]